MRFPAILRMVLGQGVVTAEDRDTAYYLRVTLIVALALALGIVLQRRIDVTPAWIAYGVAYVDVVLMSDEIEKVDYVIHLGKRAQRVVRQNVYFSLGWMAMLVVAAATVGIPLPLAVVAHEGSTLLVAANGLRLLQAHRTRRSCRPLDAGEPCLREPLDPRATCVATAVSASRRAPLLNQSLTRTCAFEASRSL